ncbi:MAG: TrmH family RNA methyltransferase [Acidimicrobiia bacterium]
MPDIVISDPADPRVSDYVGLTDGEARRADFFIAEGPMVVDRLLRSTWPVRSVLLADRRRDAVDTSGFDGPVYVAAPAVMNAVVGFDIHRGVLAAGTRRPLPALATLLEHRHRIAVLDAVNDHENLGVIFRTAAALGIDAVVLSRQCSDPLYRRCLRVSMGYALDVPFAWVDEATEALEVLHDAGFRTIALATGQRAVDLDSFDLRPDEPAAVVAGSEAHGLGDGVLDRVDTIARIAMRPGVDSLNVATACAIAFHRFGTL